jgi:hypothetical protein
MVKFIRPRDDVNTTRSRTQSATTLKNEPKLHFHVALSAQARPKTDKHAANHPPWWLRSAAAKCSRRGRSRRLARPCSQADIDRRPHHPGQDIKAWQSLPARSLRAGGLGCSDPAEGLKPWIEAAKKRLHGNVLAIALANKLASIAWSVLAHGRNFEVRKIDEAAADHSGRAK